MIAFIDDHRGAHGVEPICKVLPIAPSTYHAHVAKRHDPAKLSTRAKQDAALKIEVRRVFDENFRVYGVRKVGRQRNRGPQRVATAGTLQSRKAIRHNLADLPAMVWYPVAQAGAERLTRRAACIVSLLTASMARAGGSIRRPL
jgi:hypothetical protein